MRDPWLMFELILGPRSWFQTFLVILPRILEEMIQVETIDQEGPPDEDEEDLALEANEDGASKKSMMCVLTERIHVW